MPRNHEMQFLLLFWNGMFWGIRKCPDTKKKKKKKKKKEKKRRELEGERSRKYGGCEKVSYSKLISFWQHVTEHCQEKKFMSKLELMSKSKCITSFLCSFDLVWFYGISTIVGYLMPNSILHIY